MLQVKCSEALWRAIRQKKAFLGCKSNSDFLWKVSTRQEVGELFNLDKKADEAEFQYETLKEQIAMPDIKDIPDNLIISPTQELFLHEQLEKAEMLLKAHHPASKEAKNLRKHIKVFQKIIDTAAVEEI